MTDDSRTNDLLAAYLITPRQATLAGLIEGLREDGNPANSGVISKLIRGATPERVFVELKNMARIGVIEWSASQKTWQVTRRGVTVLMTLQHDWEPGAREHARREGIVEG